MPMKMPSATRLESGLAIRKIASPMPISPLTSSQPQFGIGRTAERHDHLGDALDEEEHHEQNRQRRHRHPGVRG